MKMKKDEFEQLFDRIDNGFVGTEAHVYQYQRKFADFFRPDSQLVVDFGCGQGAFLRALTEKGINCIGVDINPINIEICQKKGYNATLIDGREYIRENEGYIDGIFLAHVIEHYNGYEAVKFLVECYEALNQKGRLALITPNFEDQEVRSKKFWLSATHVRPYPLMWLKKAFEEIGFRVVAEGHDPQHGDTVIVGEKR